VKHSFARISDTQKQCSSTVPDCICVLHESRRIVVT